MFERYTEKARRVIFFARYETSQFGSPYIETEHLLLGLLREDKALTNRFLRSQASVESIRKQIEGHTPVREKVSTSVDLPLSNESKRVLAYAAEEAERLSHKHIGTEHLLLGLLREEKGFAAEILQERGLRLSSVREQLAGVAHSEVTPQVSSRLVYGIPGTDEYYRAEEAAQFVLARTQLRPKLALVLGSGLGELADELADPVRIPYEEIPHYPRPTAEGHTGRLVIGELEGVPVAAMQGRIHFYEGVGMRDVVFPMRVFGRMGVRAAILTNAAGGISDKLKPGCLVALSDHINLQGVNPLCGPNDERFGTRFPDLSEAYDSEYREMAIQEGRRLGIDIVSGVYAAMTGPCYETPAEIRYLRIIGADVVGMSTVAEVIVARHMSIRVLAISCVTNMAAGILKQPITHEEVLATGHRVRGQFAALLRAVVPQIAPQSGA